MRMGHHQLDALRRECPPEHDFVARYNSFVMAKSIIRFQRRNAGEDSSSNRLQGREEDRGCDRWEGTAT
jgi:hypothetical protein